MATFRRSLRLLAASAAFVAAVGCLSPTLPLPPPEEPDFVSLGADGAWEIRGTCAEGAEVVVLNEATGRGAVVLDLDRNGRYAASVAGDPCDVVVLSQSVGEDASGDTRFVLQEIEGGIPVDAAACE